MKRLSADETDLLKHENVNFEIPSEFRRNDSSTSTRGTILSPQPDSQGHTLIRYRSDLICPGPEPSPRLAPTLIKLETLIDVNHSELIKTVRLENYQILIVDNGRWLHGRTKIFDKERHLLRIRFQVKSKCMLPWENQLLLRS